MDPLLLRFALVLLVVLLATLAGRVWQRRDGRVTATDDPASGRDHRPRLGLATDHRGPQAVLFGSDTCAPCDTVKGLLREVETERDDFRWHYVDAADAPRPCRRARRTARAHRCSCWTTAARSWRGPPASRNARP